MKGIARSIAMVALFVFALWAIGGLVGFEIGLVSTLIASITLTVVANLLFAGFRKVRES